MVCIQRTVLQDTSSSPSSLHRSPLRIGGCPTSEKYEAQGKLVTFGQASSMTRVQNSEWGDIFK